MGSRANVCKKEMKKILALLLVLCGLGIMNGANPVPAPAPTVPDDEEDPYYLLCDEASRRIAAGDYESAAARLIEAISIHPTFEGNVLLLSNLGMVYSCLDRDSLAIATFDKALAQAPGQKTVLNNRARVLIKMGRDSEAFRDFATILQSDSINLDARFYHGTIALYSGDLATAEADFGVLRRLAPESTSTAEALATLYSMTGRDLEAVPYLKRLIALDPSAEYYATLAGCYIAADYLAEASDIISRGLEKYPHDPELYYYRARMKREQFLFDEAAKDLDKAVEYGLSPTKARQLMGKK